MARRQSEEVINVLIDRKTHGSLRILQVLFETKTLSETIERLVKENPMTYVPRSTQFRETT